MQSLTQVYPFCQHYFCQLETEELLTAFNTIIERSDMVPEELIDSIIDWYSSPTQNSS